MACHSSVQFTQVTEPPKLFKENKQFIHHSNALVTLVNSFFPFIECILTETYTHCLCRQKKKDKKEKSRLCPEGLQALRQ